MLRSIDVVGKFADQLLNNFDIGFAKIICFAKIQRLDRQLSLRLNWRLRLK